MERQKSMSPFTRRARKLFSRALKIGVDPSELISESQRALRQSGSVGRMITRGDLSDLRQRIRSIVECRKDTTKPRVGELRFSPIRVANNKKEGTDKDSQWETPWNENRLA